MLLHRCLRRALSMHLQPSHTLLLDQKRYHYRHYNARQLQRCFHLPKYLHYNHYNHRMLLHRCLNRALSMHLQPSHTLLHDQSCYHHHHYQVRQLQRCFHLPKYLHYNHYYHRLLLRQYLHRASPIVMQNYSSHTLLHDQNRYRYRHYKARQLQRCFHFPKYLHYLH